MINEETKRRKQAKQREILDLVESRFHPRLQSLEEKVPPCVMIQITVFIVYCQIIEEGIRYKSHVQALEEKVLPPPFTKFKDLSSGTQSS